jgi:hypothetical protein
MEEEVVLLEVYPQLLHSHLERTPTTNKKKKYRIKLQFLGPLIKYTNLNLIPNKFL